MTFPKLRHTSLIVPPTTLPAAVSSSCASQATDNGALAGSGVYGGLTLANVCRHTIGKSVPTQSINPFLPPHPIVKSKRWNVADRDSSVIPGTLADDGSLGEC